MKSALLLTVLVITVSVADCFKTREIDIANKLVARGAQQQRDIGLPCFDYQCQPNGGTCEGPVSEACSTCITGFLFCGTDCSCADAYMNCTAKANCSLPTSFLTCKLFAPDCSCGNYTYQKIVLPVCGIDSYCSNSTSTCVSIDGEKCSENNDCKDDFIAGAYTCENHKCILTPNTVQIGGPCDMDDDCVNAQYGEASCVQGVCVGQSLGGNCNSTESCNFGLYCKSGKCADKMQEGAACNVSDDSCAFPTLCGFGNVCTKALSKSKGQSCVAGAECATPNTCINGKCAAFPAIKSCGNDTDCPEADGYTGVCTCNVFGGGGSICEAQGQPTTCNDQSFALYECADKNDCGTAFSDVCLQKNCMNEINCMRACVYPSECTTATCAAGTTAAGGAASVVASVGLVALAVAAAL